jgi:hypothetical protein
MVFFEIPHPFFQTVHKLCEHQEQEKQYDQSHVVHYCHDDRKNYHHFLLHNCKSVLKLIFVQGPNFFFLHQFEEYKPIREIRFKNAKSIGMIIEGA